MGREYWKKVQDAAFDYMKRKLPGWTIQGGDAGVPRFCLNGRPDIVATKNIHFDKLDIVLGEVKAYDDTPLRKSDVD